MAADHEIETGVRALQVLSVALLKAHRQTLLLHLLACLLDHRARKIDPGDAVSALRQLKCQEAGSAAGVERVEGLPAGEQQVEHAVPGRPLAGSANAVAEVAVEAWCSPVPVGGDLALDRIGPA